MDQSELALLAINSLETVDIETLKKVWIALTPGRRAALKKKLMALAFI